MARLIAASRAGEAAKVCADKAAAASARQQSTLMSHMISVRRSDLDPFPAASAKYGYSDDGEHRFGRADGEIHAARSHATRLGEPPGQRNLKQPIAKQVDPGGRGGI